MGKLEHDTAAAKLRLKLSTDQKPWFKSCISVLEQKEELRGKRCLDLCCGNGEFAQILRNQFEMEVVCADYIPFHLNHVASAGFETIFINFENSMSDVLSIANEYAESFDVVVNLAAIEHIFNTSHLLRFVHCVLKSDGKFLVNTPNISFAGYRLSSAFSGNRPFGEGHHIRFWDYRFLRTNLYLHGFGEFEDFRQFHSLPYDPILRAFRNNSTIARVLTPLFRLCKIFSKISSLRSFCSDELTVMAQKENIPIPGFELHEVRENLAECTDPVKLEQMKLRLRKAREYGWIDEHLYLGRMIDGL